MNFSYKIADDFRVSIYVDGAEEPSLIQPVAPDGSTWKDATDATAWAKAYLAHIAESIPAGISELEAALLVAEPTPADPA